MTNHNNFSGGISAFNTQPDIEVVMDIINKYYCIADSVLVNFQRRAKEQLIEELAEMRQRIAELEAV